MALQLVFISAGAGCIEWKKKRRNLKSGEGFFVMPGIWHRYRPDTGRGWTEHWFEVRGDVVDEWLKKGAIDPELPHFKAPSTSIMPKLFEAFHSLCREKRAGFQPVLAGMAHTLLAEGLRCARTSGRGPRTNSEGASRLVREAQRALRDSSRTPPDIAGLARQLGTTYPTFLRRFRKETGINPKEYLEQLRMARAEELLASGWLGIKEISEHLQFHSAFHFSTQFKKRQGLSPSAWRKQQRCKLASSFP